mmetsp:Transcript_35625/g.84070  ORF Transcript_35625/g.84070 Transcript_35625/m.84070 type:complete len:151 (-) Transcript_35625:176-628(-)
MAGTVHLSEKLLLDEHVSALCTMLRGASPYTTTAGTVSTQAVNTVCTLLSGKAPVIGTRRIFLERNNIGDAGAKQLASLLEEGMTPNVTSIRLYMNEIGDEGAAALVRAALSGAVPKLKSISLDTNQLSVEGKAALRRQCATAPDLSLYL